MSRQEAETGSAASEYLTVPELAKMVRLEKRVRFPESGVEGIERELGDEGAVATVGREG